MSTLELSISSTEFDALVRKIQHRLEVLEMHPWHGANDEEIAKKIWDQVHTELLNTIESNRGLQRNIVDTAIVFGSPLDETVFMLVPISSSGGNIIRESTPSVPGLEGQYQISFYGLIK
jgi:hypothetical protein